MTEVIMPKMGDGMEEGTLLEWLKKDGDKVKSGEVIGNIQTDKATLELEAPASGTLAGFLIKAGDTVPVGQAIGAVLKDGESLPSGWGGGAKAAPAAAPAKEEAKPQEAAPKEEPQLVAAAAPAKQEVMAAASGSTRVKASPLAKKIAQEKGLDLSALVGTGPGGRIVEKDVVAAATNGTKTAAAPQVAASAADTKVPLNRLRQITAQRTQQSKQQVPHFYVTVEVDVEKLDSLREMFKSEDAGKISVNDFVIKACALALREMPVANSTYQGDHLLQYGAVNIGMAIALDDGLTVAVIKNADQLTLRQISWSSKDLAAKAKANKLTPDDLSHSTFSISNMGMLNVDVFSAIINTPNAGILAIGTASKKVVVNEDEELEVRKRMNITGSFDHRVVDGAVGAKFVNLVKGYLENPARLLS